MHESKVGKYYNWVIIAKEKIRTREANQVIFSFLIIIDTKGKKIKKENDRCKNTLIKK